MSIKPKPILHVSSSSVIPEETRVRKNKPFSQNPNSHLKTLSNLNFHFKNNWVYTLDTKGECFNHKTKNTTIKEQEDSFLSKIFNTYLLMILSSINSFIQNVYLINSKVFYNLSLLLLISEIILSVICTITKIKLSQNKAFLTTLLYFTTILNYSLHIYIDSLLSSELTIIRNIYSLICILLVNLVFNRGIYLSKLIYFFIYIVITITKIQKYISFNVNYIFGFFIDFIVLFTIFHFEIFWQNKCVLIRNIIENHKRFAKIIHDKLSYPIMKLNNKKGIDYLNLKAVKLFNQTKHNKKDNNHTSNNDKQNERTTPKGSMAYRIKQINAKKPKQHTYNLHDILINVDYFDFHCYNCLMGNQKYFVIPFVASSFGINSFKTTYLSCFELLELCNNKLYIYLAEIMPYCNEKDKYLLLLYPLRDQQHKKDISILIEKARNEISNLVIELNSYLKNYLFLQIQKNQQKT